MRTSGAPCIAQRRYVEAFGLEEPHCRRKMRLAIGNAAPASKRAQHELVDTLIEGRKLEPLVEVSKHILLWRKPGEMFEYGRLAGPQAAAFCRQPRIEVRTPVYIETVDEVADE